MTQTQEAQIKVPVNLPQMLYNLVMPHIASLVWGRFTGKSEGPGAAFTINNIVKMPRSNGFIQGTTYEQLLQRTLPPLISGWERLGFIENIHFWIKRFPDPKLKIKKAIRQPINPDHYIKFYNGSGIYLVSQDRGSTINGVRTQWGFCDEAKLLNKKKFDEDTIPTMAGGAELWGEKSPYHLAEYLSLLFCSDMPDTSAGAWLLEFEKEIDPKRIELILSVQCEIMIKMEELNSADEIQKVKITNRLNQLNFYFNELRKECVYFSLASAIDNIEFVGLDPIKQAKRILTDIQFRVSILNQKLLKNEKGFYGLLDPVIHGDDRANYAYIDTLNFDFKTPKIKDCRWDADVNQSMPLDIAMDHNNMINCIVTGQDSPIESRLLSSFFVEHPDMLDACVRKWNDYYRYHPVKEVNYYHDSTSKSGGRNAMSNIDFSMEVERLLISYGWRVNKIDIGQIGSHNSRYHFWGLLLKGSDPRLPKFSYNKTNCVVWETAALQAGLIKKGDEYEKDKRSEKDPKIPPHEATHMTEAADILLWGKLRPRFRNNDEFVGMIHS